MPLSETQRLSNFTVEPTFKSNNAQRLSLPKGDALEDVLEAQPRSWESLWIDMGGEG